MTARCALYKYIVSRCGDMAIRNFSKMAAAAILNLFESKIATLDPPSPKPHPRTKHEVDRITRCRDMAIRICWGHMEPPFWGEREGRRGSATAPLEIAMAVSYRLSIVTVALSVTIRPQFAIECHRRSNQQGGWVTLDPNLGMFCLEQNRHVGVAKSKRPRLTNGEINFEEFQPM